jgi:hypothetical protein
MLACGSGVRAGLVLPGLAMIVTETMRAATIKFGRYGITDRRARGREG